MFFLRKWNKPKIQYVVVELNPFSAAGPLDTDTRASLSSLGNHPGFQYLMKRLSTQRNFLQSRLNTTRHETLRDADFLQLGVTWTNWLQAEFDRLTQAPIRPTKPATSSEVALFEQMRKYIEPVG